MKRNEKSKYKDLGKRVALIRKIKGLNIHGFVTTRHGHIVNIIVKGDREQKWYEVEAYVNEVKISDLEPNANELEFVSNFIYDELQKNLNRICDDVRKITTEISILNDWIKNGC